MYLNEQNTEAIQNLCKKSKVAKFYAFGSVLPSAFNEESDVDFLIEFQRTDIFGYSSNFFELQFGLEDLLGKQVDPIEYSAIRNPNCKEEVDETKELKFSSSETIFQ